MAITGAITLSSATCKVGQSVMATLTITNGNAEAASVVEITPKAYPANVLTPAPISLGLPPLAPGQTVSVAASGTLALSWGVTPLAPVPRGFGADSASQVYDIGAEYKMSDGTVEVVSTTTLTASTP